LLAGLSADFKNKIRICESEASETQYWLEVIVETEWLSWDKVKPEHEEWNCLLFLHLLEKMNGEMIVSYMFIYPMFY